jgi:hypothetical protein
MFSKPQYLFGLLIGPAFDEQQKTQDGQCLGPDRVIEWE